MGSNTVHLLVVDAHRGGHPTPMSSTKSVLRLAEQIDEKGRLTERGARSLIDSVDEFTRGVCELLIDASVEESSTICELCGRRGRIRTGIARVRTACESCFRGVDMQ